MCRMDNEIKTARVAALEIDFMESILILLRWFVQGWLFRWEVELALKFFLNFFGVKRLHQRFLR